MFGKSLTRHSLSRLSDYEDTSLLLKVSKSVLDSFKGTLVQSEASVFWSHLEKDGRIPSELVTAFSELDYEQARIILLFLGNMLRWSVLMQPSEVCFLCPAKFYSTHFFSCRVFQTVTTLPNFYSAIIEKDFPLLLKYIFSTLKEWTDAYPSKFMFRFRWNILSFFDVES